MDRSNLKNIGYFGENYVCDFLQRNNYSIIKKNFTIRGGEIDIIAKKNNIIAFVEVKTRMPDSLVSGEDSITYSKKKNIIKTARRFISTLKGNFIFRFDVAIVEADNDKVINLKYYAGAFDASK
ncbi:MAG: YraN family protein [Clostridiales bacterium]|nr:YraN family protein [Clostridiales bacterium]